MTISALRADLEMAQADLRYARARLYRLMYGNRWSRLKMMVSIVWRGLS